MRMNGDSVLRVALDFEASGMRMTKENLEEASRRADCKDWFEEGRYPKSSKVERWSVNNCLRNEVNQAISAKGTLPDSQTTTYHFSTRSMIKYYLVFNF